MPIFQKMTISLCKIFKKQNLQLLEWALKPGLDRDSLLMASHVKTLNFTTEITSQLHKIKNTVLVPLTIS